MQKNGINSTEFNKYLKKPDTKSRYDSIKVAFFKRMLQREINQQIRDVILDEMFEKIYEISVRDFSKELYLSKKISMK